jgi:hypothetical protein
VGCHAVYSIEIYVQLHFQVRSVRQASKQTNQQEANSTFFRNGKLLAEYTASHPRRLDLLLVIVAAVQI